MSMTRKDYEATARAFYVRLNASPTDKAACDTVRWLANDLAREFQKGNPRFDSNRFLRACGLEF